MCGRYTLGADAEELVEAFDVAPLAFDWAPRYNIAPTQAAPVVAADSRGRRMGLLTWGLVPSAVERPRAGMINVRSESVATKPLFREAFERRRCLVPADGFYEWKREGATKAPYWIHTRSRELMSFAGIWERRSRPGATPRHAFAILTTDASEDVAWIHGRMPLIIEPGERWKWLDRGTEPQDLFDLLRHASVGNLVSYPVSPRVNRPAEDDAGLIEAVRGDPLL